MSSALCLVVGRWGLGGPGLPAVDYEYRPGARSRVHSDKLPTSETRIGFRVRLVGRIAIYPAFVRAEEIQVASVVHPSVGVVIRRARAGLSEHCGAELPAGVMCLRSMWETALTPADDLTVRSCNLTCRPAIRP